MSLLVLSPQHDGHKQSVFTAFRWESSSANSEIEIRHKNPNIRYKILKVHGHLGSYN